VESLIDEAALQAAKLFSQIPGLSAWAIRNGLSGRKQNNEAAKPIHKDSPEKVQLQN
jgi:hypothetical protein